MAAEVPAELDDGFVVDMLTSCKRALDHGEATGDGDVLGRLIDEMPVADRLRAVLITGDLLRTLAAPLGRDRLFTVHHTALMSALVELDGEVAADAFGPHFAWLEQLDLEQAWAQTVADNAN
jgi:hypothetical protein